MAAQTGRTVGRYVDFRVDDSGGTLRSIPVNSINGVGLSYDEEDLTALQDSLKSVLPGQADCAISISGPFDNSSAAAAGTLSGSHTILKGIAGVGTPLSLDILVGIRHTWETGEPQFGITSSASSGFVCTSYVVDAAASSYSATFRVYGSTAPAWGTALET